MASRRGRSITPRDRGGTTLVARTGAACGQGAAPFRAAARSRKLNALQSRHPPYARSSFPRLGAKRRGATLRFLQVRRKTVGPSRRIRFRWIPMELQTHGARKYPTSALLRSSAGLGWSTISAELRSHAVSETPVIVPQHTELCIAVIGTDNGFVRRTGAGQCQEAIPTSGAIWLSPVGVGDNEVAITAPIPKAMHLYLPTTLFRRLSDDFNLPTAPAHSIRYVAGIRDEVIHQRALSSLW